MRPIVRLVVNSWSKQPQSIEISAIGISSSAFGVASSAPGAFELPRAHEITAATTQAMTAKMKASRIPEANGTEINFGKKPRPVSATTSA